MRLDKFLSNLKYGSRTEVKEFIKKGLVTVNNIVIRKSDMDIDASKDEICFNGEKIQYLKNITLIMNKPSGYICSKVDELYPSILNLLDEKYKRYDMSIAGRLDVDTEGLIILTTNGDLIHKLTSPNYNIFKTYYVKTEKPLVDEMRLESPLELLDGEGKTYITKNAKVSKISDFELLLTISEGKFHQVKRMLEAIDNKVIYLKRIQIGKIVLPDDLSLGNTREITGDIVY